MHPSRRRALRAFLSVLGSSLIASTFLLGAGGALAASAKVAVCHVDKTSGTTFPILVAPKGGVVHLAKGDYLADTTLNGRTAYAVAWTETDGRAGYSPCDVLISAWVENSGDTSMSAGDLVLLRTFPTVVSAPYAFGTWATTSRAIAGVSACEPGSGIAADLGGGDTAVWTSNDWELFLYTEGLDSYFIRDVLVWDGTAGGSDDFVEVVTSGGAIFNSLTRSQDDPFIDVSVPTAC